MVDLVMYYDALCERESPEADTSDPMRPPAPTRSDESSLTTRSPGPSPTPAACAASSRRAPPGSARPQSAACSPPA